MSRNPARKGPADGNHRAIREAIEALGLPVMDLSAAGNGVEDLLVGVRRGYGGFEPDPAKPFGFAAVTEYDRWWVLCEVKNPKGRGERFTVAQQKWRDLTRHWPRIVATSAQDAVEQIRRMQG